MTSDGLIGGYWVWQITQGVFLGGLAAGLLWLAIAAFLVFVLARRLHR